MIPKLPTIKGYSLWTITGDEKRRPVAVKYIVEGLASGALKPVIDRTFKFDEIADAHRYLKSHEQFGRSLSRYRQRNHRAPPTRSQPKRARFLIVVLLLMLRQ
jgi:Zinc-binding dehydrogenase